MMKNDILVLTPKKFIEHLLSDGDFQNFGPYLVRNLIRIPTNTIVNHHINLGKGHFESAFHCNNAIFEKFSCGKTIFLDSFYCENAIFNHFFYCNHAVFYSEFSCLQAVFESDFHCDWAHFSVFSCGKALFKGSFACEKALFTKKFSCDDAIFTGEFSCNTYIFNIIIAEDNIAIGKVIFPRRNGNEHFKLNDFRKC